MKISITYDNDRGTPAPDRIHLKGETGQPAHGRFWSFHIVGATVEVAEWYSKLPKKLSAPEVAVATYQLEKLIGITDPTSMDDWSKCGVEELHYDNPAGFVNWPDSDLGKGWDGSSIQLANAW